MASVAGYVAPPGGVPPLPAGSQRLSLEQFQQLLHLAVQRPEMAWQPGRDIGVARNAHYTNLPDEMAEALASDYDYLEGDVRTDDKGVIVMAHDKGDPRGMSFEEWLAIGGRSGRGLKMDFKDVASIMPALAAVKRHGIPAWRIVINVTVAGEALKTVTDAQLRKIRAAFPQAIINLSVDGGAYPPQLLVKMAHAASVVGQPAMFPLRADLITTEVVSALRRFGRIAAWNSPDLWSPESVHDATMQLRRLGVDGTIDLQGATTVSKVLSSLLRASVNTFGWTVTMQFLSKFTRLRRGF